MELQAKMEMTANTEPLDNQRPTLLLHHPAKSAVHAIRRLDPRALLDPRDQVASLETLEPLDNPRAEAEALAHLDHLDLLVDPDPLDPRDPLDLPANNNKVVLDQLDPLVLLELQDPKDPPDQMVNPAKEAAVPPLDPLDLLDPTANPAAMDPQDLLDNLVELEPLAVATTARHLDWRLDIKSNNIKPKNIDGKKRPANFLVAPLFSPNFLFLLFFVRVDERTIFICKKIFVRKF